MRVLPITAAVDLSALSFIGVVLATYFVPLIVVLLFKRSLWFVLLIGLALALAGGINIGVAKNDEVVEREEWPLAWNLVLVGFWFVLWVSGALSARFAPRIAGRPMR